ncbi:MAG TPA: RHS repeat-associated core domain-containing protein [Thermoanaerobaculia bacterium]|nr:RHS repeat-associated core domain-containing protein [Thermoanaerobaculia bacterium]
MGNPTQITGTIGGQPYSATFTYQDPQYFLTEGSGPWGTRTWTYDKIGNRLSETRGSTTDSYTYFLSPTGGHAPHLQQVALDLGGITYYGYDQAGNVVQVSTPASELSLAYDAGGQLFQLFEGVEDIGSRFILDGRGFLAESATETNVCAPLLTEASYSSEGLLYQRRQRSGLPAGALTSRVSLFYFAGRPVAQLESVGTLALKYLTTDHLGTPILAMSGTTASWAGGFGADWNGAQAAGIFLRFPGQWSDPRWSASGLYHNVHRWYEAGTGRYMRRDPLGEAERRQEMIWHPQIDRERFSLYAYVDSNPLSFIDPLGLLKFAGCTPERQAKISQAFKDYCSKVQQLEFQNCMCGDPSIPRGLQRLCKANDRTIKCSTARVGKCSAGTCAWSIPGGGVIRLCEDGWTPGCGPLGCTLMHEMTHQLWHSGESKPEAAEKCLGCP